VRIRTIGRAVIAATMTFALAAPAAAQGRLGAGISFQRDSDAEETGPGFAIDYSHDLSTNDNGAFAVVGDLGWNKYEFFKAWTLQGGARYRFTGAGQLEPFAQFLVGRYSYRIDDCDSCGDDGLALTPGFGVDVPVNGRAAVRGQVDIPIVRYGPQDDKQTFTYFRVFLGMSFPVGGR